ncbi:SDR family oxidoreductase [Streptomyces sp. NPDC051286]|uniref:SDR family oxidoreductase n=1 Tax=Streptomyces sp. NPDC051286 TaxID=3365647 RepID=UPI0037AA54C4
MTDASAAALTAREQDLAGQRLIVIGGSCGIGLKTAQLARARGAAIILVARDPDPLHRAGLELEAGISAFDATDFDRLGRFFDALPEPVDHVVVTGRAPGAVPQGEFDLHTARRDVDLHLLLPLHIARRAAHALRPAGSLLLIGGAAARRGTADAMAAALTAARPALTRSLALDLAPVRVNAITASFTSTPPSAAPSGQPSDRGRSTLLAERSVGPADLAALAVHLMLDTAVTGATVDIADGRRYVPE